MNELTEMIAMQRELDKRIKIEHQIEASNTVEKKILALIVELGELANETRCFKFWSYKGMSDYKIVLEEYVDVVHFILSIGIELNFDIQITESFQYNHLTDAFLTCIQNVVSLQNHFVIDQYQLAINHIFSLGKTLDFSIQDIFNAYISKNKVNHQRQSDKY